MALEHSAIVVTFKDYDLESTTVQVNGAPVAEDGTNWLTIYANAQAVADALAALALGTEVKRTFIARTSQFAETRPASKAAQRETKLFIGGENFQTFQNRHITLGTFDTSKLADIPEGSTSPAYVDLTAGDGLTLKNALDDYWTDAPNYLVQIVADKAIHVGRNT